MTIEEVIYTMENKLTLIDVAFDNAIHANNVQLAYGLAGQKSQLIIDLELIKQLNEETRKDFGKENCEVHETVLIRWAHKCKKCGKIFEGH